MKIQLSVARPASTALILTCENYADVLQIRELREAAQKDNVDIRDWHNEDGKGITFFLKDERDAGQ